MLIALRGRACGTGTTPRGSLENGKCVVVDCEELMRAFMVLKSPKRFVAYSALSGGRGTLSIGLKASRGSPLASRSIQAAKCLLGLLQH